jgi:hypothetical protein
MDPGHVWGIEMTGRWTTTLTLNLVGLGLTHRDQDPTLSPLVLGPYVWYHPTRGV